MGCICMYIKKKMKQSMTLKGGCILLSDGNTQNKLPLLSHYLKLSCVV